MVRELSQIDYLVEGINKADGIRDAVDVVEKLNDILSRQQKEVDAIVEGQRKKDVVPENLVDSIRARVEGKATEDTRIKADALGNAVKRRIAEAKEQGREINKIVIDDDGIKAGNSKDDEEER